MHSVSSQSVRALCCVAGYRTSGTTLYIADEHSYQMIYRSPVRPFLPVKIDMDEIADDLQDLVPVALCPSPTANP
jgi:hypothetical protein